MSLIEKRVSDSEKLISKILTAQIEAWGIIKELSKRQEKSQLLADQATASVKQLSEEMKVFKDEMAEFKDEMQKGHEKSQLLADQSTASVKQLSEEMKVFKDEMQKRQEKSQLLADQATASVKQLSEEMKIFKDEMAEFKDEMAEFKDEMAEFKDEMAEFKDEMAISHRKLDETLSSLKTDYGYLTRKLGSLVEDIIAPSLPTIANEFFGLDNVLMELQNIKIRHPQTRQLIEFDVILVFDGILIVNETKSTIDSKEIKKFDSLIRSGALFDYFPQYKGYRIIPIMASLQINKSDLTFLTRKRIYAIEIKGELATLVNYKQVTKMINS